MSTSSSCKDDNRDDSSLRVKDSLSNDKEKRPVEQQVSSIHAAHVTDVYQVPINVIIRPIPSVLDETKVESLMETIQVRKKNKNFLLRILFYKKSFKFVSAMKMYAVE